MVDATAMQANPVVICNNAPSSLGSIKPGKARLVAQGAQAMIPRTLKIILQQDLRDMIPDVVWNNVYRTDETHVIAEDCELIKFTFFNDQTISLKAYILPRTAENEIHIETLCDDFEEWCATAIMKCDAGEDVWKRPKPGVNPLFNLTAVQIRTIQSKSQSQQVGAGNVQGGFGQAGAFGQGAAQGLARLVG